MVWFRIDDKLHDHPKAWKAGIPALGLWSVAGSWCGDNLTDGFVPDYVAARWDKNYRRLAARLVDAGLWTPHTRDGVAGWQFHDWREFQPTAEKVKADRQAAAERQARARDRARESQQKSRRDSHASHTGSHGPPDPTRPDPREGSARTTARPAPFCPRHPHGTDQPCTACGNARRAHDTWTTPTPTPPTLAQRRAELARLTAMEDTA